MKNQFTLITLDIYKTERAKNTSMKKSYFGITVQEAKERARKEYPTVFRISLYGNDQEFLGNI